MSSDQIILAGMDVASGRKPITFAVLDGDLHVQSLETWTISESLTCLREYENILLAISIPPRTPGSYNDFKNQIIQAGFKPYSSKNDQKLFLETNAHDCFYALIGQKPLPRRTLEGRLQRSAILYEQGLEITDPIEVFEEITRYKLMQGILPLENIYSAKELDALMAAYLAWMAVNRPGQILLRGEFAVPAEG
ncbi:MAG TPA: hypothetical protein VK897_10835 [Anaerolineales bacterium]|nr:hypothetical protein [Anaerolineales bacterium]